MQIQATGSLSLSAGSILLKGTDGLHLNTTTDALDLEEGVNNLSSEILLKASMHQSYPEPLLSSFEQQVAKLGIDVVLDQRKLTNVDNYAHGAKHDLLGYAKGLWNFVVDIGDIVLTGQNDEDMRRTYSILNHGKEVAPLEERNATFKGMLDTVSYVRNTSIREMKNDALDHVKDTMELLMERERNKWLNPLTSTPEENYRAGQTAVQAAFAELDLAATLIPGEQAFTAPMKFFRKLKPGKFGERVGKQVGERAEKSGISAMLGQLEKKEGLPDLAAGDGKLKTHAIRIPNSPASLEDFLQSIAQKMNLGFGSHTPATAGGHWDFHDLDFDLHNPSKGSGGNLSPERQKQKNALESGEYTGRSAEGPGDGKRLDNSVPTVASGKFNDWFNGLTADQLDELWQNKSIRKKIERQLRAPGGMHEWHLVSRAPVFKRWGISSEQIRDLRTVISEVEFVNPPGKHGGLGSTAAHNELLAIIDSSTDYETFIRRLNNWANYRLKGGINSLPQGLRLD
ncbi:hypothetical protein [Paenibacillus durus]|uniref:hypothetical protein n=1 Tax=Paenibacillus durus TaxID=44251 RepID=UPI001E3C2794|nr:hypothetical protein [Paenibacillus durus]